MERLPLQPNHQLQQRAVSAAIMLQRTAPCASCLLRRLAGWLELKQVHDNALVLLQNTFHPLFIRKTPCT